MRAELGQSIVEKNAKGRSYLRIDLEGIAIADERQRSPVNIAIVIDRSGSMRGEKLRQARLAAIMAIHRLEEEDTVSVIAYSDRAEVVIPATRVSYREDLIERIRAMTSKGRTALYAGVKKGVSELRTFLDETRVNRVILLSDGLANVGPSSPSQLAELGRDIAAQGIAVTTIGLGLGFNEDLMTKLAYSSDGNHAFVEHPDQLVDIFNKEFGDVLSVVVAGVKKGVSELRTFLDETRVNRVILLSDGLANVGPSSPSQLAELGRDIAAQGIAVTTIGLGLGFNEDLMTKLAYSSDGNHAFVEHPDQLVDIFNKEFGDVLSVVAQDVEIHIDLHIAIRPRRVMGRKATISGNRVSLKLNQLYGAQEKYIVLEFDVDPTRLAGSVATIADVKVSFKDMISKRRQTLNRQVSMRLTGSREEAEKSVNKRVMTEVVNQIAIERNERAVKLRDLGKIMEAKRQLRANSAYLKKHAKRFGSKKLGDLARENDSDAEAVSGPRWNQTRKAMRARQYKGKTQQAY